MKNEYIVYVHKPEVDKLQDYIRRNNIEAKILYVLQSMDYMKYKIMLDKDEVSFMILMLGPDSMFYLQDPV